MKNSKIVLLAVLTLVISVCVSQAQPVLLVRFPFTNTDGLTTLASDTSSGGANLTLHMLNNAGAAADFEGSPGGGVSGLGVALDLSTNTDFTINPATGIEGANGGTGPIADNTGSTALNFGTVSNYTATVWFNANSQMPNTGGNSTLGPRIFILGANGLTDKGVANSISIYWQQWNEVAASIGATEVNFPLYANFVSTNQWLFFALAVTNGTNVTLYAGTDQTNVVAVTKATVTAANGTINLTNALGSVLLIGNRTSQARNFDGWIDDFRFYAGAATTNQVEDIRWFAVVPVNLVAVPGNNTASLTWNALSGALNYNVLRSATSGGPYTPVASGVTSTSYTDTTVVNGNTYYYVVSAVDANGDGTTTGYSPQATAVPANVPAPPGSFTATPENTSVLLNWNASAGSPAAASYNISRSLASGGESGVYANVPDSGGPTTTFTDTSVTNGIKYFYTIAGVAPGGAVGSPGVEVNAIPFGPPLAPAGVTITSRSINSITLTWTDPNPSDIKSQDSYQIFSSVNGGAFNQIGTTGIGVTTYTDNTITVGNTYAYEVVAVNNNESGGPYTSSDSVTSVTANISQAVTLPDIAEQTIRAAADGAGVVNDNGSGTIPGPGVGNAVGFLRVKYLNDGTPTPVSPNGDTTSCAKTYFRWTFAGNEIPNTNADLQMAWTTTTIAGSELSTMILWSLNQPYPFLTGVPTPPGDGSTFVPPGGPTTGVTWDNAQANDTNYNAVSLTGTFQMLTNGSKTATPLVTFTDPGEGDSPVITIPAPWGNLIHQNNGTNELVFCLGGALFNQGAQGYRIANQTTVLNYSALLGTNPPSMSALTNMTVAAGQSGSQGFTVADPAGNVNNVGTAGVAITSDTTLAGATVSSDTTGGASAQVTGSGASQTVTVTAGPTGGTCTFEVTITDEYGDQAQRTFTIVVPPPITISGIANTNTLNTSAVVVPFTVTDEDSSATLTATAAVDAVSGPPSSGIYVLANAVVAHVSGPNYTVTVTPVSDAQGGTNGIGLVDLTVTDSDTNTSTTAFAVMVQASAETVFSDAFNYNNGSSLIDENGSVLGSPPAINDGVWNEIGISGSVTLPVGPTGTLDLSGGGNGNNDSANAVLLGAPYTPGHGYVIYTTFQANWSSLVAGNGWLALDPFGDTLNPLIASVGNVPDAAGDGGFNATIDNNSGDAVSTNQATLQLGTTYNIATRYDVDRGTATLWVNATNEADPNGTNVTATDVTTPEPISDIVVNENGGVGGAWAVDLDDLTVTVVSRPAINSISVVGGNVQIVFTAGVNDTPSDFGVNGTANLTIPPGLANPTITPLGGGVFQATLPVSASQGFYQVYRQPFGFSY